MSIKMIMMMITILGGDDNDDSDRVTDRVEEDSSWNNLM